MNSIDSEDELICPISRCIMSNPVTLSCGHTFDKDNLTNWMSNSMVCPTCRCAISSTNLTTNWNLKQIIDRKSNAITPRTHVACTLYNSHFKLIFA